MTKTWKPWMLAAGLALAAFAFAAPSLAQCTGDGDCSEPRPYCNTQTGNCEACIIDSHCAVIFPSGGACTASFECVECVSDPHCPPHEVCEPFSDRCVECTSDSHCASTQYCAAGSFICMDIVCQEEEPCWSHDDCGGIPEGWCNKFTMQCECD